MRLAQQGMARAVLFLLVIGLLVGPSGAADSKDGSLPDADYPKVVEAQVKVLQEALKAMQEAKEKEEVKKAQRKAHNTAVLLAAAAQDNLAGKDGAQRATLRDAAVQIVEQVKKGQVNEAVKLAGGLKDLKADAKAKTEKVKLFDAHIDLDILMSAYKLPKAGGQGWEKLLLNLATDKKKTIPPTGLNDALLQAAYQSALIADLSAAYVPAKDKKDWDSLCVDMKKGSLELAEKVKAKDGKAAFAALSKLNTSCSVCHDKFR